MKITKTNIDGLIIIEPQIFKDDRGSFFESWNVKKFQEIGIEDEEVVKELSLEFESLLYKFFVLNPDSPVFKKYEKEFYKRLKKTLNY